MNTRLAPLDRIGSSVFGIGLITYAALFLSKPLAQGVVIALGVAMLIGGIGGT